MTVGHVFKQRKGILRITMYWCLKVEGLISYSYEDLISSNLRGFPIITGHSGHLKPAN